MARSAIVKWSIIGCRWYFAIRISMEPQQIVLLSALLNLPADYFDTVFEALTTFSAGALALASSTTTVIFIPLWPSPQ